MELLLSKKFSDFIGIKQRVAPLPESANPDACCLLIKILDTKKFVPIGGYNETS